MDGERTIRPHTKDIGGGFVVRRLLPSHARQAVGPFLFFDHFGPLMSRPGDDHDVRPHPHIGLATVTYLFDGAMVHRDSTGVVQRIEPGAINWMTAGSGIVHSERAPDDLRDVPHTSHGLQLWCALPEADEEAAPTFVHTPAESIPCQREHGAEVRVLVGEAFGATSPVATRSPTLYLDVALAPGGDFTVPAAAPERALYLVQGDVAVDDAGLAPHHMLPLAAGTTPRLTSAEGARLVVIGGEPLGHRFMWWNFVSSRKERIVQAADDWDARRFAPVPGDDDERIPLPDKRPR